MYNFFFFVWNAMKITCWLCWLCDFSFHSIISLYAVTAYLGHYDWKEAERTLKQCLLSVSVARVSFNENRIDWEMEDDDAYYIPENCLLIVLRFTVSDFFFVVISAHNEATIRRNSNLQNFFPHFIFSLSHLLGKSIDGMRWGEGGWMWVRIIFRTWN